MHLQQTFTVEEEDTEEEEEEDTEEEGTEEEEEEEQCPLAHACPPHSMADVSQVSAGRHSVRFFLLCCCLGFCIDQSLCVFLGFGFCLRGES